MTYPYSDDYMVFEPNSKRYILTEKDVSEYLAIDLTARLKNKNLVNSLLNQVSLQVYRYIHQFNMNTQAQDYVIAKTCDGRRIIKEAMEQQLIYFLTNGDLSRSTDEYKRELWFDEVAKETLFQPIREIGTSICYSGRLNVGCIKW